ncbi:MAG: hypothetical protein J0L92_04990 [Deltaproteobacteria bacterium]|nr:hypothetical protein [Deltaproteobacteria bacterium]
MNGTLSLADRREGCFWERLVKFPDHSWIPAFDDGRGHYVLVDANDPEGPLLLDGAQSIHLLDLTLPLLLEQWLSGTLDRSTWSIEGEHDSMLPHEVAARRPPPSTTVRGTRLRPRVSAR